MVIEDAALAAIHLIEDPEVSLGRVLVSGESVSDKELLLRLAREIVLQSASRKLSSSYEGDRMIGRLRARYYLRLVRFVCREEAAALGPLADGRFAHLLREAKKEVRYFLAEGEEKEGLGRLWGFGGGLHFDSAPLTSRDLALFRSLCVRVVYRSARAKIAAEGDKADRKKKNRMYFFAKIMLVLEKIAKETSEETGRPRDLAVSLWALQGRATAMAFLDKGEQIQLNRKTVERICDLGASALEDPDIRFVYDLAMLGLAENDSHFLRLFGEETWIELVSRAYDRHYPDFPGRALTLVKYLDGLGRNDEADGFIQKALSAHNFGKPSQVAMVYKYLGEKRHERI